MELRAAGEQGGEKAMPTLRPGSAAGCTSRWRPPSAPSGCGEGQGGEGDEGHAHAEPEGDPGQTKVQKSGEGEPGHHVGGEGADRDPEEELLRVHLDELADQRHDEERGDPAGAEHEPRVEGGVAHQHLEVDRQQDDAAEEVEEDEEHDHVAGREGAVPNSRRSTIGCASKFVDHEQGERKDGDGGEDQDQVRVEPVLRLALVQDELQRAQADGEEDRPGSRSSSSGAVM